MRATYEIQWTDPDETQSGTVTGSSGGFSGKHTYTIPGDYAVTVTLTDAYGNSTLKQYSVKVE